MQLKGETQLLKRNAVTTIALKNIYKIALYKKSAVFTMCEQSPWVKKVTFPIVTCRKTRLHTC